MYLYFGVTTPSKGCGFAPDVDEHERLVDFAGMALDEGTQAYALSSRGRGYPSVVEQGGSVVNIAD